MAIPRKNRINQYISDALQRVNFDTYFSSVSVLKKVYIRYETADFVYDLATYDKYTDTFSYGYHYSRPTRNDQLYDVLANFKFSANQAMTKVNTDSLKFEDSAVLFAALYYSHITIKDTNEIVSFKVDDNDKLVSLIAAGWDANTIVRAFWLNIDVDDLVIYQHLPLPMLLPIFIEHG